MNLIEPSDIIKSARVRRFGGENAAKFIMLLARIDRINKIYKRNLDKSGLEFIDSLIEDFEIKFHISEEELAKIPKTGSFVTVSNHPFGGIDGLLLLSIIKKIRPDYKIHTNFLLEKFKPIEEFFLPKNPFDSKLSDMTRDEGRELALNHLKEGNSLGIFPAGEISSYNSEGNIISDQQWKKSALRFIKDADIPIIPIYFQGANSRAYHLLGLVHPLLKTVKLPSEFLNKKNKLINIRIGNPITPREQRKIKDLSRFGRFLRAKTYAMGSSLEVSNIFSHEIFPEHQAEEIIPPVDKNLILDEVNNLRADHLLFTSENYEVISAPTLQMPNLMREIGRLREITFREVGEGTNRSMDVDEFDLYYHQLFIWDKEENTIVGAYRIGKGKEILDKFGIKGFYIQSLFKLKNSLTPILAQSIELGRSFIVQDYQRKPLPLFLLWKGILFFLIKNPEYKYMMGPVSISNRFSNLSKSLIVNFIETHYFDNEIAKSITPRTKFKVKDSDQIEPNDLFDHTSDINDLDKLIKDIEQQGYRMPVLLKKYIKLNGKIIGFNLDPKFNDALDGLLILDINDVPYDTIASLSKELQDDSLLERFEPLP